MPSFHQEGTNLTTNFYGKRKHFTVHSRSGKAVICTRSMVYGYISILILTYLYLSSLLFNYPLEFWESQYLPDTIYFFLLHNHIAQNQHIIFFNVFVPDDKDGALNALEIVKDQIVQVSESIFHPTQLFYNVIGNTQALDIAKMASFCSINENLKCVQQGQYAAGDETLTLQNLKVFCDESTNNPKVTYLHNKGSYHNNKYNNQWRRALTAAAMSKDCIQTIDNKCNLCGLQFFTQFTFFIPGNMWTADCDYVKKLLPVHTYKDARSKMISKILLMKLRGQLKTSLFPNRFCPTERMDFYGVDRFASEHWVASHPDIIPCDMDPYGSLDDIFTNKTSLDKLSWSLAPRNHGFVIANDPELQTQIFANSNLKLQEYYLLAGQLVKWFFLYGKAPPEESWVWKWFPDGAFWKQSVNTFGSKAVEAVTSSFVYIDDGNKVKTSTKSGSDQNFSLLNPTVFSSPSTVIFFHISVPSFEETDAFENFKTSLEKQFTILGKSYVAEMSNMRVPVFYTLSLYSNAFAGNIVLNMCAKHEKLQCICVDITERDLSGETMDQLYSFCRENVYSNVIYINNDSFGQLGSRFEQEKLKMQMTRAVTSEQCFQFSSYQCDTCGLLFHVLYSFFYPGNMFVAQCKYVFKLISPNVFEQKMEQFISMVLLERLRGMIISRLFPDEAKHFGLDFESIQHWVGSHPTIRPCDISGATRDITTWSMKEQLPFSFPQHVFGFPGVPFDYNEDLFKEAIEEPSFRMREYHFLPGNILKWLFLYDMVPPQDSWIWKTFPDGSDWRKGFEKYGSGVVSVLTHPYVPDREF